MKILSILLIASLFIFGGFSPDKREGYTDLNQLFRDFPVVLKSGNWKEIENYCFKLLPDEATLSYMRKSKFSYHGLPGDLEKFPLILDYNRAMFLSHVAQFRYDLERRNKLQDLTFVRIVNEETMMMNEPLGIEFTETYIILKSGDTEIRCQLGEILKINGVWKSFAFPKLG
jgi:hypothetical protein